MTEITKNIVKGTKKLSKQSKKVAKNIAKGTQEIVNDTISNTNKIADKISKGSKKIYKKLEKGNVTESLKHTGNLISETLGDMKTGFDNNLDKTLKNQYLNIGIKLMIAVYAAFLSSNIPVGLAYFFDNLLVKIFVALLIVLIASKDPSLAILVSLAYILSLQTANKYRLMEKTKQVEPSFNNEYFSNDQDISLDTPSSDSLKQNSNQVTGYKENDLNSGPDNFNQNYQRVDGCQNNKGFQNTISENLSEENPQEERQLQLGEENNNEFNVGARNGLDILGNVSNYDSQQQLNNNLPSENIVQEGNLEESHQQESRPFLNNIHVEHSEILKDEEGLPGMESEGIQEEVPSGIQSESHAQFTPSSPGCNYSATSEPLNYSDRQFIKFDKLQTYDPGNTNLIGGVNQDSCVQSLQNQSCVQGTTQNGIPSAYSKDDLRFSNL